MGVLAKKTTLFRLNRKFWRKQISVDISSPIDKSTTSNTIQFEYKVQAFDVKKDGYAEVQIYHLPDPIHKPSVRILKTSQILEHSSSILTVQGIDVGVNTIELVLYKNKNRKKFGSKKRSFKNKRISKTWTVIGSSNAVDFIHHDLTVHQHLLGVWEDNELSGVLFEIAKNVKNSNNKILQGNIKSFASRGSSIKIKFKKFPNGSFNPNPNPNIDNPRHLKPKQIVQIRAGDGKGVMHWAYEFNNQFLISWCKKNKFNKHSLDIHGKKPFEYSSQYFVAPTMTDQQLKDLKHKVKNNEVITAAPGYEDGKSGWYANRYGALLWYDVTDSWVRVNERQLDGTWSRDIQNNKQRLVSHSKQMKGFDPGGKIREKRKKLGTLKKPPKRKKKKKTKNKKKKIQKKNNS